jgi:hypothetical protein
VYRIPAILATIVLSTPIVRSLPIASTTPGQDITVLVWKFEEENAHAAGPLMGVEVTLVGTDPASTQGVQGQTDANGEVLFPGVSGPFTVTAQFDYVDVTGLSIRTAQSIVDHPATTGTIGMPIFLDAFGEEQEPTEEAYLSGSVANLPSTGTDTYWVRVTPRSDWTLYWEEAAVDSTTGFYSFINQPIPAGEKVDLLLECKDISGYTKSVVIPTGPITPTDGQYINFDFDFDSRVEFDHLLPVTYDAKLTSPDYEDLELELLGPTEADGTSAGYYFHLGLPTAVTVPDPEDPMLHGFEVGLYCTIEESGAGSPSEPDWLSEEGEYFFDGSPGAGLPPQIDFGLLELPDLVHPSPGEAFTITEAYGMTLSLLQGPSEVGDNGWNAIRLYSDGTELEGLDVVSWEILFEAASKEFQLPRVTKSMFGPGARFETNGHKVRLEGQPFDIESIYNENVGSNFLNLDNQRPQAWHWSDTGSWFSITPHVHAIDYFPLIEGAEWTLALRHHRTFGTEIINANRTVRMQSFWHGGTGGAPHWDGATFDCWSNDAHGLRVHAVWSSSSGWDVFSVPIKVLDPVVEVGDYSINFKGSIGLEYEVLDTDAEVTTPAGTFTHCIQLRETIYESSVQVDDKHVWLAPGVGKVAVDNFMGGDHGLFWEATQLWSHTIPPPEWAVFCSGDGSGTACPCTNIGATSDGCVHSHGEGGRLSAAHSNSAGNDEFLLFGADLVPSQSALLFAGSNAVNGGEGIVFGDGLRCAGGGIQRLGVRMANAAGSATWGPGLATSGGWHAGETVRFQIWFRDPAGGPCGSPFNLSNGLETTFAQ